MLIKKYIGELWVNIKGYEGLYQVSNFGRIKSLERFRVGNHGAPTIVKERIMMPRKTKGYYQVGLCKNNRYKYCLVHRLVAQAFIPNPKHLPQVNHKDENTANCRLSNLEWCTSKYNINYGTAINRRAKTIEKPICQYTLDGVFVKRWDGGATEAGRELGFNQSHITECCMGKRNKHKGFVWKYGT